MITSIRTIQTATHKPDKDKTKIEEKSDTNVLRSAWVSSDDAATSREQRQTQQQLLGDIVDNEALSYLAEEKCESSQNFGFNGGMDQSALQGTVQVQTVTALDGEKIFVEQITLEANEIATAKSDAMLESVNSILKDSSIKIASESNSIIGEGDKAAGGLGLATTIQPKEIEGLFYKSKLDFSIIGVDFVESTVLLLKSGWAYVGLKSSPLDLAPPDDDQETDGAWSRWRTEDGLYQMQSGSGEWRAIDGVQIDITPLQPSDINGTYSKTTAQDWGGTTHTQTQNLILTESGEFITSRSNLVTAGGISSLMAGSHVALHSNDVGLPSAPHLPDSSDESELKKIGSSEHLLDKDDPINNRIGSYSILSDGLTIEFRYANGAVKRELFFRTSESNRVFVGDHSLKYKKSEKIVNFNLLVDQEKMRSLQLGSAGWQSVIGDAFKDEKKALKDKDQAIAPQPWQTG